MKRDTIEITPSNVPYKFEIMLAGEMFQIGINYNETAGFFTMSLAKKNTETGKYDEVCASEPIIYGVPLWQDVYRADVFPAVSIIPLDESGENNAVTFDNLGRTVFLTIDSMNSEN